MVGALGGLPAHAVCGRGVSPVRRHDAVPGDLEELHAFAARIGLKRAWFQRHRLAPHYDLTVRRREAAVRAGAIELSFREQKARGVGRTKAYGGTLPDYAEQEP